MKNITAMREAFLNLRTMHCYRMIDREIKTLNNSDTLTDTVSLMDAMEIRAELVEDIETFVASGEA
jgi:hypothetical protein